VVDDEHLAHEVIRSFSEKVQLVEIVGYFTNPLEAVSFLQAGPIDLIFLDIEMAGFSGIELVSALPRPPMIIFTTAFADYAVKGFELSAVDYLLKPFSMARFLKACNRAYDQHLAKKDERIMVKPGHIFINADQGRQKLEIADILYVESKANYVQIVTVLDKFLTRLTMKEAEALFIPHGLIRIHRSFLVAKIHISRYTKKEVIINSENIPIGENYIAIVLHEME
jgi:DNA-binding LytR/AlgR family response regulator